MYDLIQCNERSLYSVDSGGGECRERCVHTVEEGRVGMREEVREVGMSPSREHSVSSPQ